MLSAHGTCFTSPLLLYSVPHGLPSISNSSHSSLVHSSSSSFLLTIPLILSPLTSPPSFLFLSPFYFLISHSLFLSLSLPDLPSLPSPPFSFNDRIYSRYSFTIYRNVSASRLSTTKILMGLITRHILFLWWDWKIEQN